MSQIGPELHISVSEPYPGLLKIASLYLVLNPASFPSILVSFDHNEVSKEKILECYHQKP